jgi:phage shock protein E
MKKTVVWVFAFVLSAAIAFAAGTGKKSDDYRDPAQLAKLIEGNQLSHVLVDVRTPEEYAAGHIPTAVNIPVTEIADRPPGKDKSSLIIVYCRSGARSAKARTILIDLGYTDVVDFGGVSRWTGKLVSKDAH